MRIARFNEFIFEKYTAAELKRLVDLGIMSDTEARIERRRTGREDYLSNDDSIGIEDIRQILSTDGAKKLMAMGLHHVSSKRQLMNGNVVFSLDPNYNSEKGWGIGFFAAPRKVRRMAPKNVKDLTWSRDGSMDIEIRQFSSQGSDLDFYNTAMSWAAEHINFDISQEDLANPNVWKYYVKKKSARDISPN
jgi:hypothetical protein